MLSSFFASAGSAATCQVNNFLGLVPWYKNVVGPQPDGRCGVILNLAPTAGHPANWDAIWIIALNLIDDLLRVAGFLAVVFVLYGGIRYIVSQGEPQNTSDAQGTILNALVGLVIAGIAASVVSFLSDQLGSNLTSAGNYQVPNVQANGGTVSIILNIILSIVGAVSVIMVMIGGWQYMTSRGESQQTAKAKNTILYAVIGLAVCAMAFILVNYVLVHLL